MESYTLNINSSRGVLTVKWQDVDTLANYATLQSGLYGGKSDTISKAVFDQNFVDWTQRQWAHREKMGAVDLPDNAVVLDVGSGIAVQDLLLYSFLPESKLYLLDKEQTDFKSGVYYSEQYPFYNTWKPVNDAIETSGFDSSRFIFLSPTDQWPETDCVTSYYSWCFHYPKETYWQQCLNSLKIGGKLVLDIRKLKDRDVVEEISDEFGSKPEMFVYPNHLPKWVDDYRYADPEVLGYRCVWVRRR